MGTGNYVERTLEVFFFFFGLGSKKMRVILGLCSLYKFTLRLQEA